MSSVQSEFAMSSTLEKAMSSFACEVSVQAVRQCALKYGFDGDEAVRELGLLNVAARKSEKKEKAVKVVVEKVVVEKVTGPSMPLPFSGEINKQCCQAVRQNHGLYTQCMSSPKTEESYCKSCLKQASKNSSGEPDFGTIFARFSSGAEYRDPKGKAPVHYTKVMKKLNLTQECVEVEAQKYGVEISASHFSAPEQKRGRPSKKGSDGEESESSEKKKRGRPMKKVKEVEIDTTEDLFATLMQNAQAASPRSARQVEVAQDDMSSVSSGSSAEEVKPKKEKKEKKTKKAVVQVEEEVPVKEKKEKKTKKVEEDKAAKNAEREQMKQQDKESKASEKEAEKVQAKMAKEAAKAAAKEEAEQLKLQQKEAEKQARLQKASDELAAKAEAEQLKLQQKEARLQKASDELAAKQAAKATKETTKPVKETKSVVKVEVKQAVQMQDQELESESDSDEEEAPAAATVSVKKFVFEGTTYLRSSEGLIYHAKTQELFGRWNDETKTIDEFEEDSEEEEESDDEE